MKILFVTHPCPNPNGQGWERRAAQHLRALVRSGQVTVVLPWQDPDVRDLEAEARCWKLGASEILRRGHMPVNEKLDKAYAVANSRIGRAWASTRRLSWFESRPQQQDVAYYKNLLADRFDVVFAFRIQSAIWTDAVFRRDLRPRVAVIDFDDVESRVFESRVLGAPGHTRFWNWKLSRQLQWLRKTERRLVNEWSATCLCSELDAGRWLAIHGQRPWIIPNAYEFGALASEPDSDTINLLFIGTFSHAPNVEGVLWFVREAWPAIRRALGEDVTLTLVGFTPPDVIANLDGRDGIRVVGDAPDVAPFYSRANIVIAPVLAGSGTRIKLIEAAAHGRASVTTTLGCEGLDFTDGVHAEIADDPQDFVERVIALTHDKERRARLAERAFSHARARFECDNVERNTASRIADLWNDTKIRSETQKRVSSRRTSLLGTEGIRKAALQAMLPVLKRWPRRRRGHAVIIPPCWDSGSLGDHSMISVTITELRRAGYLQIDVLSETSWPLEVAPDRYIPLSGSLRRTALTLLQLATYEHVLLIGADVLDATYNEDILDRIAVLRVLSDLGAAATVVGSSFGAEPRLSAVSALRALPEHVVLCARDPVSQKRMELSLSRPIRAVADLAFLQKPDAGHPHARAALAWIATHREQGRRIVGINVNASHEQRHPGIIAAITAIATILVADNIALVLVPHDYRSYCSDVPPLERLRSSLNDHEHMLYLLPAERVECTKAVLGALDFLVTGRMHAAILAMESGTPALSFDYAGKFEGLYQLLGLTQEGLLIDPAAVIANPALVVEKTTCSAADLSRLRARLLIAHESIIALARANFAGLPN